jgi:hypothetical protein
MSEHRCFVKAGKKIPDGRLACRYRVPALLFILTSVDFKRANTHRQAVTYWEEGRKLETAKTDATIF